MKGGRSQGTEVAGDGEESVSDSLELRLAAASNGAKVMTELCGDGGEGSADCIDSNLGARYSFNATND